MRGGHQWTSLITQSAEKEREREGEVRERITERDREIER